jgi:hypothetical protein
MAAVFAGECLMNQRPDFDIVGMKGGKGGSSSSGSGGGVEAPNSLRSKQTARIIDLLSEGIIWGPVNWTNSVYFDGVALTDPNGNPNFSNWQVFGHSGWPDQSVLPGFAAQQAEVQVGLQLKTTTPLTRTILDTNVNRVRLTVSVPALQIQDTKGNINGTDVTFNVYMQSNGGGYALIAQHTISGKTNTRYQRSLVFSVFGAPPWDIKLARVTADSTVNTLQNDLYWDSYTEIIDTQVNYTLSAVVGVTIDAEQFQSIPKRTYFVNGLIIAVPSNYDPVNRSYSGVWDGTLKWAFSNNPAWVFFDLLINSRYGLGNFIGINDIDRWTLYRIAQWCDNPVPNGKGGYEPRWVCNAVIADQHEAFDLLQSMVSVFRGWSSWAGGQMVPGADMPADPTMQYTNANVIDGTFNYASADRRGRHNQYLVSWNDPANLGQARVAIVEDQASISKFGIQKSDVIAIGCTSESQAIRVGKWMLFTDNYEADTVTFVTGLDTAWARPGDIVQVADVNVGGERRGGRVISATASAVTIDTPVTFLAGKSYALSCVFPDGHIETKSVAFTPGSASVVTLAAPFSAAPLPETVWVLASSDLQPTLWRVLSVRETDPDRYEVTAQIHHPDKWAYVENNIALSNPDVTNIGAVPPVIGLNATDYLVALSAISVGSRMLISWQSDAPVFDVSWRPQSGNWINARTDQQAHDVEATETTYDIWVTPINSIGRRGATSKITYTVIGRYAPPADVKNFRIQVINGVAMFQWAPAQDIDVIIGGSFEMRYSPSTVGVTWTSANTILTSIPGTATTVEVPYRPGTYLLKAKDIVGLFSVNAAVIITTQPDAGYQPYLRICEQPDWLGNKNNTEVRMPQQWLVLGVTGGLWDDQMALMDTWPTVDVLPYGSGGPAPSDGTYNFFHSIDMGGVFPVRLTVDMLAFPFVDSDVFIDQRIGNVDDWQSWDDAGDDGAGMVTIRVRQTDDDPASASARWTQWAQFTSGTYTGRGFQFQAWLAAPPGQNVAVEQLCILADISAKADHGADIVWIPNKMHIAYSVKFFNVPSISIAIQQGVVGDTFRITNKTRDGFDLELIASTGAIITASRTFDWIAAGY